MFFKVLVILSVFSGGFLQHSIIVSVASAQVTDPEASSGGVTDPEPSGPGGLVNPLRFTTLQDFLVAVLDAIILILFPFLVLAIVYAGFKFVTAQGKAEALSEARRALLWVLIGALIILGAKALSIGIAATVRDITTYAPAPSASLVVYNPAINSPASQHHTAVPEAT